MIARTVGMGSAGAVWEELRTPAQTRRGSLDALGVSGESGSEIPHLCELSRVPMSCFRQETIGQEASERVASDDGDLKLNNSTGQVMPASLDISVTVKNHDAGKTPELSA